MNIRAVLEKYAKKYPSLSFEAKLLIAPFIYILLISLSVSTFVSRTVRRLHIFRVSSPAKKHINSTGRNGQKRQRKAQRIIQFALGTKLKYVAFGSFLSFLFIFLPLTFLIFLQDLPDPTELMSRSIPQTTKIYDRNNVLLTEIYAAQNRTIVPLSSIPKSLQEATLAIEDKNFYKHPGFDLASIIRAAKEDLTGSTLQGGSTITQQLIKSSILTSEQSFSRKIKELVLAFWAERIYSKQQILEMYFNQVPYGGTAWGVEAASEVYFGKTVKELNLAESAFLAGLTAAPTTYSPFGEYPTLWKKRQKEVLNRMVALSYITKKQAEQAAAKKLIFKKQITALHAPHFVDYIKALLARKYGLAVLEKGGLTVKTSLDLTLQEQAQQIVKQQVANDSYLHLTNGAAVVTNPKNGDILAMVGSKDFNDPNGGNVNIATSLRQPGSSIKVVTYSAALMHGFTAASILEDTPQTFHISDTENYTPVNYDGQFHGRVPLRLALANSLNLPAVKVLNQVGVPTMVNLAKDMGITSWGDPKDYGLSITLGGAEVTMLDMATVNGTLANQGIRVDLNPILSISDARGKTLEQKDSSEKKRVLPESVAYIISHILADNQARTMAFGPNSALEIPGHTVSVKTGTSDNKRDNWANGYTANAVVVVWVGNNDNTPMSPTLASGVTGAAPIWNKIMSRILTTSPETPPVQPASVVQRLCFGRLEVFVKGTENNVFCGPQVLPTPVPLFQNSQGTNEDQDRDRNQPRRTNRRANRG